MTEPNALTVVDLGVEGAALAPGLPSRVIATVNESCVRLAVYQGEADWHRHETSDEAFLVLSGELELDVFHGSTTIVRTGQLVTISAGVVHRPRARSPATFLVFKHQAGETAFFEEVPADASGG